MMAFFLDSGVPFEARVKYSKDSILLEKIYRAAFLMVRAVPQTIYWIPLSFSAFLPASLLRPPFSVFKTDVPVVSFRHCHRLKRARNIA
jgi:hypothetical protein